MELGLSKNTQIVTALVLPNHLGSVTICPRDIRVSWPSWMPSASQEGDRPCQPHPMRQAQTKNRIKPKSSHNE